MRPAPIAAEYVPDGARRVVVAPPDGDLTNPDIAPVEALTWQHEGARMLAVRIVPDEGDLDKLAAGGDVWLTFHGSMPPFALTVTGPDDGT